MRLWFARKVCLLTWYNGCSKFDTRDQRNSLSRHATTCQCPLEKPCNSSFFDSFGIFFDLSSIEPMAEKTAWKFCRGFKLLSSKMWWHHRLLLGQSASAMFGYWTNGHKSDLHVFVHEWTDCGRQRSMRSLIPDSLSMSHGSWSVELHRRQQGQ